jgi:hypothetical protein
MRSPPGSIRSAMISVTAPWMKKSYNSIRNSRCLPKPSVKRGLNFLQKYYVKRELPPAAERAAIGFLLSRLPREWPQAFHLATEPNRVVLTCRLTSKRILFAPETDGFALLGVEPDGAPPFACALDALISQIPEDLAIVVRDPTVPSDRGAISGRDRLAFLHVCSPSHWAPEEKAGLDFRALHAPVPGFERLARAAGPLVEAMIQKGPFVRFVWSFVTDRRLNHHPEPPPNWELSAWRGRAFDASKPESEAPFYLRIERQVTWGLPAAGAALFFIRVSFIDGRALRADPERRARLLSALHSMTPESRVYKGVSGCFEELINWLSAGRSPARR